MPSRGFFLVLDWVTDKKNDYFKFYLTFSKSKDYSKRARWLRLFAAGAICRYD